MNIFTLTGTILVDSAKAEQSISKTGQEADGLGSKLASGIKTAAKWAAGITAAATAVGGAMIAAAKDTAESMDTIDKASQRMGIDAESYQELAYQAELCGVNMSTMEAAAKKLEGTDINFDDAMESIWALGTAEERSAKAAELFGDKVAYQLSPMLNQSASDMDAMAEEARNLGLVIDNDTVTAGANLNDMFTKVQGALDALKTNLMTQFMPYIQDILQWVLDNMPQIQETVGAIMEAIWPIVKAVLDLIMQALPPLLNSIKAFLDWIMPYLKPIIDGIAGVVQGVIALINGDVGTFAESIKTLLSNLGSALFGIGKDIFNSLWDGIKSVWEGISSWITDKANWLKDKLAFWRSGQSEMKSDGSHASGLPVVPYDGYVATLHRGETIMSASSVNQIVDALKGVQKAPAASSGPISVQLNLDSTTLARLLVDPLKKQQQFNGSNYISMGGSAV